MVLVPKAFCITKLFLFCSGCRLCLFVCCVLFVFSCCLVCPSCLFLLLFCFVFLTRPQNPVCVMSMVTFRSSRVSLVRVKCNSHFQQKQNQFEALLDNGNLVEGSGDGQQMWRWRSFC
ncbi:unnamed protein product [Polarella glacialis]|uniref:Uncharacterized protein n=1 Tax=Polarella glacialis TaxID=89957 RepID=A0A813KZR6_POLGL|nr:unnamed protein product [Polarella glacialis]CAE8717278.1 unnamed protein product [Polarella glacialis]